MDNASERGAGRLAVSYDAGNTCVTWDILTGGEVARFAAYEPINVASFMRNGNVAFGNVHCLLNGSIVANTRDRKRPRIGYTFRAFYVRAHLDSYNI